MEDLHEFLEMKKYYLDIIKYKDKRIAELEQDLEFTTKTANELIEIKHKLEQELAELKEKAIVPRFKVNDRLFVIVNNEIEEYYVDEVLLRNKGTLVAYRDICKKTEITEKNEIFATEQEALNKLKEIQGNE